MVQPCIPQMKHSPKPFLSVLCTAYFWGHLGGRAGQGPGVAAGAEVPDVHAAALRAVQQLPRPGRHLQHRALPRRRLPQACSDETSCLGSQAPVLTSTCPPMAPPPARRPGATCLKPADLRPCSGSQLYSTFQHPQIRACPMPAVVNIQSQSSCRLAVCCLAVLECRCVRSSSCCICDLL